MDNQNDFLILVILAALIALALVLHFLAYKQRKMLKPYFNTPYLKEIHKKEYTSALSFFDKDWDDYPLINECEHFFFESAPKDLFYNHIKKYYLAIWKIKDYSSKYKTAYRDIIAIILFKPTYKKSNDNSGHVRQLGLFEKKKDKQHIFLNYYISIHDDHDDYTFFMANHYSQFVALTKFSKDSWHFIFQDGWCAVFNDKKRLLTLDEIEKVASIVKL